MLEWFGRVELTMTYSPEQLEALKAKLEKAQIEYYVYKKRGRTLSGRRDIEYWLYVAPDDIDIARAALIR